MPQLLARPGCSWVAVATAAPESPLRRLRPKILVAHPEYCFPCKADSRFSSKAAVSATNMNLLARTKYVNDHYPPAKNPLLYGAARTERYINIMRNCTLARMDILGW